MKIGSVKDIEKWMYRVLLLFPIGTLLQSQISVLNKGIFGIAFFMLLYLIVRNQKKMWEWVVYGVTIALHVFALLQTNAPLHNKNELFYFLFIVLLFTYISGHRKGLYQYWKEDCVYVQGVITVWTIVVGISIFLPSSYQKIWGTGRYFTSFTGQAARFASTALFIMALCFVMFVYERKKRYVFGAILPMACFYMSGSRTYLGLGILAAILFWYVLWEKKRRFYQTIIPFLAGLMLLMGGSAMKDKWESTLYEDGEKTENYETYGVAGAVSNSRTVFWKAGWDKYCELDVPHKLFGGGYNLPYDAFYESMGVYTWMHNDFLQLLLIFGAAGLGVYIFVMGKLFHQMLPRKIPLILRGIVILVWLLNACWNMFYTYSCAMICYPFLLAALWKQFETVQQGRYF